MTPAEIRAASRSTLDFLYREGNAADRIAAREELDRRRLLPPISKPRIVARPTLDAFGKSREDWRERAFR